MMLTTYWSIFWRTFAQLALASLLAAQGLDWATTSSVRVNAIALGLGLLVAIIGALSAALWAFVRSPAVTALAKAFRSAAQALAGAIGAVVVNEVGDLLTLQKAIVGSIAAIVLAFAVTFFSNQGTVPPETTSP